MSPCASSDIEGQGPGDRKVRIGYAPTECWPAPDYTSVSLPHSGASHLSVIPVMPTFGSSHSLIKLSVPRSHHEQIGRPSRSGSAAAVSTNSSGTSIDVPDPGQFEKCAAKPIDGKPRRRSPRVLLSGIGMLAPGDPLLGRTLVAACHCAECAEKTSRFLRRGFAIGRSDAVEGSQIGLLASRTELRNAGHGALLDNLTPHALSSFTSDCPAQPVSTL